MSNGWDLRTYTPPKDKTWTEYKEQLKEYRASEMEGFVCNQDKPHVTRIPVGRLELLVIRVVETKTRDMIDKCMELTSYEAQYRMPWIVFDRDQVKDFDEIIREAKEKGIGVALDDYEFSGTAGSGI